MSKTDQFWQYAKEAVLAALYAKTDQDMQDLHELARTWTQAALQERASLVDHDDPPEISAARALQELECLRQIRSHPESLGLQSIQGS